jgi:DNA-binding transcriptional MerR regulator
MNDSSTGQGAGPGSAVEEAVRRSLLLVDTWIRWEGRPRVSEDGDRVYTPAKAVRRIADHLVDHLAEVEAVLAGVETQPDAWHGSLVTLESDWARFTELDRDEVHQRLTRLARTFALRLEAAGPAEWDRPRGQGWTLREIAEHLTGVLWYAEQVGDLSPTSPG